jgi:hypothetical protein
MDAAPDFRRDVLMSIRPVHVSKVLKGQKTVELRRRFPELGTKGATAFIYSSSPVRSSDALASSTCSSWRFRGSGKSTAMPHAFQGTNLMRILLGWPSDLRSCLRMSGR